MAIMDKQSVREEFERLKSDFNTLNKAKKVSPELCVIVNGLIMLLGVILAIFLEKKTRKTKNNSSKPPSQTHKDDSALGISGSKGKGKSEDNLVAANTRTIETTTLIPVDYCNQCGESLKKTSCRCIERRTKIDIIFEKNVEHVDAEVKDCPTCHAEVKGTFPNDMKGPLQYGNGIKAFVICLLISQMVALKRAQNMLKTLIGKLISETTLLDYIMRLHSALEQWEHSAKEKLLRQPSIHTDETSLRVDKKITGYMFMLQVIQPLSVCIESEGLKRWLILILFLDMAVLLSMIVGLLIYLMNIVHMVYVVPTYYGSSLLLLNPMAINGQKI